MSVHLHIMAASNASLNVVQGALCWRGFTIIAVWCSMVGVIDAKPGKSPVSLRRLATDISPMQAAEVPAAKADTLLELDAEKHRPKHHHRHGSGRSLVFAALESQVESPRSPAELRTAIIALGAVCGGVVLGVSWIYWSQGWTVVLLIQAYIALLVVISLWVKTLYKEFHFHYPVFITVTHLVLTGLACKAYVMYHHYRESSSASQEEELVKEEEEPVSFWRRALLVWPIAAAQALSIVARNTALDHATVSMVEMLSSSTPLVTITISTIMGEKFRMGQWCAVLLVVAGTAAMLHGDRTLSTDLLGVFLVFSANVTRSLKSVLQSHLLGKGNQSSKNKTLDTCSLWVEMAPCCVVLLMVLSAIYEGTNPYRDYHLLGYMGNAVLFASCLTACALNVCGLQIMKYVGATGMHIVGSLKIALTVFASILIFHESVLVMQLVGTCLAMVGAWVFSHKPAAAPAQGKAATLHGLPQSEAPQVKSK